MGPRKIANSRRPPRIRLAMEQRPASQKASQTSSFILVPAVLLGTFGLMMGFSATSVTHIAQGVNPYQPFLRTLMIAAAALVIATVAALLPPRWWERWAFTIFVASLILQLLVIPFGITEGGNTNWLNIPGINQSFQPSEFLKLGTALMLGRVLSGHPINPKSARDVALWVGIPSALAMASVMAGGDMGTMLVFVAIVVGALWMGGVPGRWLGYLGLAGTGLLAFLVTLSPSRVRRILEFLPGGGRAPDPSAPTQTDHGLWALGSGGLTGVGPGASKEKWNYLQEAHTDFILAIIGEEFGLVGTITLLMVVGALIYGIFRLSAQSPNGFVRASSGAIGAWIAAQTLINVGTVIGLVPVIGVPFPLVSYGGSSFLFTALAIGVLLSFARYDVTAVSTETDPPRSDATSTKKRKAS